MKVRELFETPVFDISYQGDFDAPGTFKNPLDRDMIRRPVMVGKLAQLFSKAHHFIRIHFLQMKPDERATIPNGKLDKKGLGMVRAKGFNLPNPGPEDISVILTSNENHPNSKMPMSPWMVGHRIAHAILETTPGEEELVDLLMATYHGKSGAGRGFDNNLGNSIGTMGSARAGRVKGTYEFVTEALVQYMTKGHVVLRPYLEVDEAATRALEEKINTIYARILDDAAGNTFIL